MSPISTIPTTSPGRNKLHIKNTRSYTSRLLSAYLLSAYLLSAYLLSAYLLSAYLLPTFYIPYLPSTYFSTYFLHTLPRILPSFSLFPSPSSSLLLPLTFISLPLLLLPFLLSLSSPPFSFSLFSSFFLSSPSFFLSFFSYSHQKTVFCVGGWETVPVTAIYIYVHIQDETNYYDTLLNLAKNQKSKNSMSLYVHTFSCIGVSSVLFWNFSKKIEKSLSLIVNRLPMRYILT